MSRFDTRRFTISGTLVTGSPLAIGALADELVDIPIQVDGQGVPIIPGTAVAGALRARMSTHESAWGSGDQASSIVVNDAPWKPRKSEKQPLIDVREGVSLNRYTRTAEVGFLYNYEVIPRGTQFDFTMTVDAEAEEVVSDLLAHLTNGFAVGRSTTKGLGRLSLVSPSVHKRNRSSREDLIAYVTKGESPRVEIPTTAKPITTRATVTVPWQAHGPLLVADASLGDAVDVVPKVARFWKKDSKRVSLVIPGSSTKGALRAHSESILRTVLDVQAANRPEGESGEWGDRQNGHKHDLRPEAGMRLVALLFGTAGDRDGQGQRGAITVNECHSRADWSWHSWSTVVAASKDDGVENGLPQGNLLEALCRLDGPCRTQSSSQCRHLDAGRFVIGEHVAIDRWTGGAADGALYSVLEPWLTAESDWTPLVLDIDTSTLPTEDASAAIYLLLLTLRDFCEGWIPLGYGSSKGYGQIDAPKSRVTIDGIADSRFSLDAAFVEEPSSDLDGYRNAWMQWIAEHKEGRSDER